MNSKQQIIERIRAEKIIPIIRLQHRNAVQKTVDALVAGGMVVLEITTNTPGFCEEIKKVREKYPHVLIGAGTVITANLAKKAVANGAQFLVTPNTSKEVVDVGKSNKVPVLMGAMTPTEVTNALAYGADIIKLFPAMALGISYFESLKGPFDTVPFFAVGGINESNINDWFKAGIDGVGLGSGLVKSTVSTDSDFKKITATAKKFKNILANA